MRNANAPLANPAHRRSVLLIGNYRTTLVVMRSLSRDGFHVILGTHGNTHGNERSRYCDETWPHPDLNSNDESFALALDRLLTGRADIQLVYPVTEEAVVYFAQRPDSLPDHLALASAGHDGIALCQDKQKSLALAATANVPCAAHAVATDMRQLEQRVADLGYPCVVRPIFAPGRVFGRKAIIARSPADLKAALPSWPPEHDSLLLQRYVLGARHNVYFFAREGQVERLVQIEVKRTDRADGTGLAVEGVSVALDQRMAHYTYRLADALNYSGAGSVQFLVDVETGAPLFLEINPRLGANCAAVSHCGVDLPLLAARLATRNDRRAHTPVDYKVGARYAWLFGDLAGLQHEFAAGNIDSREGLIWLCRMARSTLRADTHLTFSWRDPLPAFANYAGKLRRLSVAMWRRARQPEASSHA